jgi:hypothetical protein
LDESPGSGSAYPAVLDWLLEVTAELIRPEMPVLNSRSVEAGNKLRLLANGCRLRVEDRFTYFKRKVCKVRIWQDDGGLLFKRLQNVAGDLMKDIARLCDDRFESLCMEPGGADLTEFFASPQTCVQLSAGHILRQDHEEVYSFIFNIFVSHHTVLLSCNSYYMLLLLHDLHFMNYNVLLLVGEGC